MTAPRRPRGVPGPAARRRPVKRYKAPCPVCPPDPLRPGLTPPRQRRDVTDPATGQTIRHVECSGCGHEFGSYPLP